MEGSWGTKIDAISRRVLSICKEDSEAKILVFSQWEDVLSIVLQALEKNSIPVLQLQGKHQIIKRLNSFKMDKHSSTASIKSAGNGLNLVEATHVVMIEPMLNIGMERQALSRVHRIGQEKETLFGDTL